MNYYQIGDKLVAPYKNGCAHAKVIGTITYQSETSVSTRYVLCIYIYVPETATQCGGWENVDEIIVHEKHLPHPHATA